MKSPLGHTNSMWQKLISFLKNWTLPVSMLVGIIGCLVVDALPLSMVVRRGIVNTAEVVQPSLIFAMLFLTCCRIDYKQLRLHRWQGLLLGVQCCLSALLFGVAAWTKGSAVSLVMESAMLCAITPTATAAAVVANKLKGDMSGVIAYTMLSNFLAAVVLPLFAPLLHDSEMAFWPAFGAVLARILPMLIAPFLLAVLVRKYSARLLRLIVGVSDLPFYLWCLCLPISIALAMKTLLHSNIGVGVALSIAVVSLCVCLVSFSIGRQIGRCYDTPVAGAQSLGQKNTAFGIWVAYTFLTPVTSVAGGFYAIWHNVYNAWQLAEQRKRKSSAP